ncbi:MAG TPA: cytochrome P450, partial [Marmoricola sp.]
LVASTAAKLPADHLAYRLSAGLAKKYGPDPYWVRVGAEEVLLLTHPDDIRIALGGSPDPFASDPEAKRKGMRAFQPDALTISRGNLWADRRRFAEAVLQTDRPVHKLARGFIAIALAEADALLATDGPIAFADVDDAFSRITRRVVFGDAAADDTALTDQLAALMAAGNKMPGKPAKGYAAFVDHLQRYVDAPDPAALTGMVAKAPHDADTHVAGQLIHWLFAMGDTLPANLFRALALLATHPLQAAEVRHELAGKRLTTVKNVAGADYLAGCILDTMRLWPTTPLFGRVLTEDFRWPNGELTPAGTQVMIHNLFNHRNRERFDYADRFAPEEWASGTAGEDWSFNFFSHGPQGCPGAGLSILLGQAFLARLLTEGAPRLVAGPRLRPVTPLPYALDVYALQFRL